MELVLGVSVMGEYGRLALVDPATRSVIDLYDVDLAVEPAETVVDTITTTDRSLTEDGHRLVATRVSASDLVLANDVRDELTEAGVARVTLVLPSAAATDFVRAAAAATGQKMSALLFVDDHTVTLSLVGTDDSATHLVAAEPLRTQGPGPALAALLGRLAERASEAESVYLAGASEQLAALTKGLTSSVPFRDLDQTAYAVALGAAATAATMVAKTKAPVFHAPAHDGSHTNGGAVRVAELTQERELVAHTNGHHNNGSLLTGLPANGHGNGVAPTRAEETTAFEHAPETTPIPVTRLDEPATVVLNPIEAEVMAAIEAHAAQEARAAEEARAAQEAKAAAEARAAQDANAAAAEEARAAEEAQARAAEEAEAAAESRARAAAEAEAQAAADEEARAAADAEARAVEARAAAEAAAEAQARAVEARVLAEEQARVAAEAERRAVEARTAAEAEARKAEARAAAEAEIRTAVSAEVRAAAEAELRAAEAMAASKVQAEAAEAWIAAQAQAQAAATSAAQETQAAAEAQARAVAAAEARAAAEADARAAVEAQALAAEARIAADEHAAAASEARAAAQTKSEAAAEARAAAELKALAAEEVQLAAEAQARAAAEERATADAQLREAEEAHTAAEAEAQAAAEAHATAEKEARAAADAQARAVEDTEAREAEAQAAAEAEVQAAADVEAAAQAQALAAAEAEARAEDARVAQEAKDQAATEVQTREAVQARAVAEAEAATEARARAEAHAEEATNPAPVLQLKQIIPPAPKPPAVTEPIAVATPDLPATAPVALLTPRPRPSKTIADTEPAQVSATPPRTLLVGSAFVAVAFAVLVIAAGVAIAIKPTASEQAVRVDEPVPGKFLPVMPGQAVAPVEDPAAYVPRVVSVPIEAPAPGSEPTVAPSRPTVVQATVKVPAPSALPVLPAGIDLSEAFPQAAACAPGDMDCYVKATGCKPDDVVCLNTMFVACKTGSPSCRALPTSTTATIAPLVEPRPPLNPAPSAPLPIAPAPAPSAPAPEPEVAGPVAPQQEAPPPPPPASSTTTAEPPPPAQEPSASAEPVEPPPPPPVPHGRGLPGPR